MFVNNEKAHLSPTPTLCSWLQVVGGLYLDSAWPKTMLRRIWANPPPDLTVKKLHRIAGISGYAPNGIILLQ
jgi:hypothetical protein